MAARKTVRRKAAVQGTELISSSKALVGGMLPASFNKLQRENKNLIILLSLGVILLVVLFFLKRDWFIAATVNGNVVSNIELQQRLNEEYRSQALDQLVNEKIIFQAARERGVSVSADEVDQKVAELETRFGGVENLDNLLQQQGSTRESLRKQLEAQLSLEKMYASEATVSAEEVDQYIKDNKALLTSTDSDQIRAEAEKNLKEQKLFSLFSQKFQELKDAAKVTIF